jgi:excisionase family DNA binding protein
MSGAEQHSARVQPEGVCMTVTVEPLIDANEAGRILKMHPVTVREMAARNELPGFKIGKVWRFRASSLDEWITGRLELSRHQLSPEERKER